MFRSILVPLDGSSFAEQALPLAELVGRAKGTRLHLLCVGDADDKGKEQYLSGISQRLEDAGIEAEHMVLAGKVVDALEERAKQVDADLIVMATHGRKGLERLRLGSVTEGLVSRGVAPMLLLHPGPDGAPVVVPESLGHVVVALDASGFAQSILDPLESLGVAAGVTGYTLVHVAQDKTAAGHAGWTPLAAVQERAEQSLAPVRERLTGPGREVNVQVVMASDPSAGIIGIAEEVGADLIAMTTHGMTGLRPTLVGSVAAQVLRNWSGIVLLQRPAEATA